MDKIKSSKATNIPSAEDVKAASTSPLVIVGLTLATVVTVLAAIYFSGYADDILEFWAKKYYKAKAKAEATALQHAGSEKAEGYLKDQLKKNPVMDEGALDDVSEGLGSDAAKEGLGGIGKAFKK